MSLPPLYLIADPSLYGANQADQPVAETGFFEAIREALKNGIRLIQYRDKNRPRGEMLKIAEKLREITREAGTRLIINDEIDIAMAVEADGVHLGQDDFPVEMARSLLGKSALIGLSTHTLQQAVQAESQNVDYIGFGPIFETQTKAVQNPPVGIAAIRTIRKAVALPIYAIGGIQYAHLSEIITAGASGVAVASALVKAEGSTISVWLSVLTPPPSADPVQK